MKTQSEEAGSVKNSPPVNSKDPIRLAFLGGPRTGKTAIISKLSCGTYRDTYYPSRKTTPILFTYSAQSPESRIILDQNNSNQFLEHASARDDLLLSPVIYDALAKVSLRRNTSAENAANFIAIARNEVYATSRNPETLQTEVSPILTELIDTPAFNCHQFIPFLEASLHARLGKNVLRRLADTPRQPVNTEPLLVASGAGELNGTIDGYFLLYSAVPSSEPPGYDEVVTPEFSVAVSPVSSEESLDSYNVDGTLKTASFSSSKTDTTFSLLPVIKAGLEEAWKEYYTYKTRWDQGKEKDLFSLRAAMRNMFDGKSPSKVDLPQNKLLENPLNPSDPLSPPPIWIICTHKNSPLASPKLISDGKKLAQLWRCGYLAVDVADDLDQILSLVIREVVERRTLQKIRKKR